MTAPDLTEARDLAAMWKARAEAAETIIRGRDVAPTEREVEALAAEGGTFVAKAHLSRCHVASVYDLRGALAYIERSATKSALWWAYDGDFRLRPWPVAP